MPKSRTASAESREARVGEVLQRLREQLGLSLRTLASRVGFSASFLSQLEHGQVSPSISSLERIAGGLGVTLSDLFEASQAPTAAVVRASARPGFTSTWSRARVELLTTPGARQPLEAMAVTLAPRGTSGKHPTSRPVDQFAYVLQGRMTVFLEDEPLTLESGDAVMIPRKTPHRWHNDGTRRAQVLLVSLRLFG